MSIFFLLLKKEFLLELRGKETIAVFIGNILLITCIVGAGVSSAFLDPEMTRRIFPMLLWIVFLFSATLSSIRGNEQELEGKAFEALLLAGVSPVAIYLAKLIAAIALLFTGLVLTVASLSVLLNVNVLSIVQPLIFSALGIVFGYASLSTVTIAIAGTSRLRGVLLSLILLPLLFPLFFAAVEITAIIVERGSIEISSPWLSLMVAADTIYFFAGLNLYGYLLRE